MKIGQTIKQLRKAAGWNQTELGKRCGLSQNTISNLETGRNESSRELDMIAAALGVTPAELRGVRQKALQKEPDAAPKSGAPLSDYDKMTAEIVAMLGKINELGLADLRGQAKQLVRSHPRKVKAKRAA